ncbi:pentapeptide repeat-containing protein [Rhizobium laguerreae]|nr:pentapeptide repeat-containing protein [Rhizobium laguerreae]
MFDRLRALCAAKTDNLAELAEIAAPGDPAFFDGAQFSGADLRDTNLTGFRLQGAAMEGARIDETTILPETTSLLDIKGSENDTPYAIHVIDSISTAIQTEVISALDTLEKIAGKREGSNIKGPIRRRSSYVPPKNDKERDFRLHSIKKMRGIAREIVASKHAELTIGGVLKNIDRLVKIVAIGEDAMQRSEPRTYQRVSRFVRREIEKLGLEIPRSDEQVTLTRQQWTTVLSSLTSAISAEAYFGEFGLKGSSGEIQAYLIVRTFNLLEDLKDLYLALPADQHKIDPITFHIRFEQSDEHPEPPGGQEPYVM